MSAPGKYALVVATPLPGKLRLGVVAIQGQVSCIDFLPVITPLQKAREATLQKIAQVLADYFTHPVVPLGITMAPHGTPFQQRVWAALRQIPPGEVLTYGQLAGQLASSPRAVAAACRANPIPLLIPCHRVVASNGLGGYMGATEGEALQLKQWLLRHEGAI